MPKEASTQQNIPIAGIKDGVIILKNGQYRLVMEVAAINFALKSEREQNSLVIQYQGFINSLHFPIQIVVQSKKLDLTPYIKKIKDLIPKQQNELLQIQTQDYADFISQLVDIANIMKKRFFVVIGYQPLNVKISLLDKLFPKKQSDNLAIPEEEFSHYAKELRQRALNVAQGLGSMGLHCKQLNTQELIEAFYVLYNPELAGKERIANVDELSASTVSAKPKEEPQNEETTATKEASAKEKTIDNTAMVEAEQKRQINEMAREKYKQSDGQKNADADPKNPAKDNQNSKETDREIVKESGNQTTSGQIDENINLNDSSADIDKDNNFGL